MSYLQGRGKEKPRLFLIRTTLLGLAFFITPLLAGCGPGNEVASGPIVTNTSDSGTNGSGGSVAAGATVSLSWDPVPDASVVGYVVHYGKVSPNSSGSCAYDQSQFTPSPSAALSGLTPSTTYFFAVSAYNGLEGVCSNEVLTVTQPA
ncbi:fibronectin type III domain-containing protein [Petrachloros mirabilis]